MAKKPFVPNNTDKEEKAYEPFLGAKMDFIKKLEKEEEEEESKNG